MARRKDSQAAVETLQEIESVFDRMAGWVAMHPGQFLLGLGSILAVAAGIGLYDWYDTHREGRASQALAEVQGGYFAAMGAAPGTTNIIEPANPETGRAVRMEYIDKFLAVGIAQEGTVAAVQAYLEAGNLQEQAGELEPALESWRQSVDAAADPGLRGLVLARLARGLESAGRWAEAAETHEEAAAINGYPLRHQALADAARCHAEAGDRSRATQLSQQLEEEAPDLPLAPHVQQLLSELRIAGS